jgi:hypothetical protein
MRVEALLPIAQFLGRAWSGKNIKVVIGKELLKTPRTYSDIIELPSPSKFPVKGLVESYRLWREALWHEAMHQYFGIPKLKHEAIYQNYMLVLNAVEDYKIEVFGIREYPGMKREIEFTTAIYYSFAKKPRDVLEMYIQLLLYKAVKDIDIIPQNVVKAVNYTIDAVGKGIDSKTIAEEVCRILGVKQNDYSRHEEPINYTVWDKDKIKMNDLDDIVKNWLMDKQKINEELGEGKGEGERGEIEEEREDLDEKVKGILSAGEDIEEEFELIEAENERIEKMRKEVASTVKVVLPSQLNVDESKYYDYELITHLKSQLQKLKRGWKELHSSSGEFDVESYVSRQSKVFIDEERLKVGGYKILILVDHSGSIHGYHHDYKKACIAFSEALSSLNIPFSIYCFNTFKKYINVYLVKSFNEKWTRMNAKRLAQIRADGGTPLTEVYRTLKPIIDRIKGNSYFITLTDGLPNDRDTCREIIKKLKGKCRMYAVAIGFRMEDAVRLAENLEDLGYDRYVALDDVKKLPTKVLKLIFD